MSRSLLVNLNLTLVAMEPLHVGIGSGARGMIDRVYARDARGFPVIPGSTIKGLAKDNVFRFGEALGMELCEPNAPSCRDNPCLLCEYFGSPGRRGALVFSDLIVEAPHLGQHPAKQLIDHEFAQTGFNIKISRLRRTAEQDHLFTTEFAIPGSTFSGSVKGRISIGDGCERDRDVELLYLALTNIGLLGSSRSRGRGRVEVTVAGDVGGENLDVLLARAQVEAGA